MTPAALPLRRFIEGAFGSWIPEASAPEVGATVVLSSQQLPELPDPDVEAALLEWLDSGEFLKALTLLKLLLPADPTGRFLKPLLNRALAIEPERQVGPALQIATGSRDPVPHEFLGAQRLELAWSVLERDELIWAVDSETQVLGAREWKVARSTDEPADPMLLVWNSQTEVAGKLRPAGNRTVVRHRAELRVSLALLGADRERFGVSRLDVEVRDLSEGGMGLWITDPLKRIGASDLHSRRVRVELMSTERGSNSALADVCWVEADSDANGPGWRMGLKFVEPTEEFTETVEELLRPGKGDIQFLWNLWQSNAQ